MWNINSIRYTFLLNSGNLLNEFDSDKYWESVLDIKPEKREIPKDQLITYKASFDETNFEIILEIRSRRIDWYFKTKYEVDSIKKQLNYLGTYEKAIEEFKAYQDKITKDLPKSINRIAFGTHSHNQVVNSTKATQFINKYIPLNTKKYTEFSIASNESIKSKIKNVTLDINKGIKVNLIKLRGEKIEEGEITELGSIIAPTLETDINTSPSSKLSNDYFVKNANKIIESLIKVSIEVSKVGMKNKK